MKYRIFKDKCGYYFAQYRHDWWPLWTSVTTLIYCPFKGLHEGPAQHDYRESAEERLAKLQRGHRMVGWLSCPDQKDLPLRPALVEYRPQFRF